MKCWIFSSHVEVHIEFGTVVFLTGAYMGGDEGEARRSEACTQFVKQCGDDSLVIADGSGSTFGFVAVEHSGK